MNINATRLLERLRELGEIGKTENGGVARLALTDADKAGRDRVATWMHRAGLEVKVDEIGNMFGIRPGTTNTPGAMCGSHLDSVFDGGRLDGAYGVLAALEVVDTLNDAQVETRRPIIVAVFTNEEGNRFQPDMMGSLAHAGGISVPAVLATQDRRGVSIAAELDRIGYAGDMACGTIKPAAFVELHIEQGPLLEQQGVTIGAVQDLQGISWTEIEITGQANHAGTTPMDLRHDAGYCAAAITTYLRDLALELGGSQVATVGSAELIPNVINVVPGRARMTVDLRNTDNAVLSAAEERLHNFVQELARAEQVEITTNSLARFDPIRFDPLLVEIIEDKAAQMNLSCRRMTSGAGHDAQMMSRICDTAMIFVPSRGGVSHNPNEHTDDNDLVAGGEVLLQTLLELSNKL